MALDSGIEPVGRRGVRYLIDGGLEVGDKKLGEILAFPCSTLYGGRDLPTVLRRY